MFCAVRWATLGDSSFRKGKGRWSSKWREGPEMMKVCKIFTCSFPLSLSVLGRSIIVVSTAGVNLQNGVLSVQ